MTQLPFHLSQDAADAARYWADKEYKTFAIDCVAGADRKPTYRRTHYARARTGNDAVALVRKNVNWLPRQTRCRARLAGPRELGCVPTPAQGQGQSAADHFRE